MANPKPGPEGPPKPLNPFEGTPQPGSVEGKIALEVLPQMARVTASQEAVRPGGRLSAILWVLAGMLAVLLVAGGVYVLTR